eukprot:1147666-Pelagomonas_calceolata.AAC.6
MAPLKPYCHRQLIGLDKEAELKKCKLGAHECREHAKYTYFQASTPPSVDIHMHVHNLIPIKTLFSIHVNILSAILMNELDEALLKPCVYDCVVRHRYLTSVSACQSSVHC